MADCWLSVDAHDNLWLLLVCLQELKRHRAIEQVGAVWKNCPGGNSHIRTSKRSYCAAFDLELTRISIDAAESDSHTESVGSVRHQVGWVALEAFDLVIQALALLGYGKSSPFGALLSSDLVRGRDLAVFVLARDNERTSEWWR